MIRLKQSTWIHENLQSKFSLLLFLKFVSLKLATFLEFCLRMSAKRCHEGRANFFTYSHVFLSFLMFLRFACIVSLHDVGARLTQAAQVPPLGKRQLTSSRRAVT